MRHNALPAGCSMCFALIVFADGYRCFRRTHEAIDDYRYVIQRFVLPSIRGIRMELLPQLVPTIS